LGRNVSVTLSLLSLGFKRKGKCYNGYFINGHLFHIEEYRQSGKTYKSGVYIKGSTSNKFEFDYYGKLKEVIKLQYHNKQNKAFLFKCYWYDTIDREIRVDPYHGLFKLIQMLDSATSTMSLFLPNNASSLLHIQSFF
jgi:hypothetical protein